MYLFTYLQTKTMQHLHTNQHFTDIFFFNKLAMHDVLRSFKKAWQHGRIGVRELI